MMVLTLQTVHHRHLKHVCDILTAEPLLPRAELVLWQTPWSLLTSLRYNYWHLDRVKQSHKSQLWSGKRKKNVLSRDLLHCASLQTAAS